MNRNTLYSLSTPVASERRIVSYFDHEFIQLTEAKITQDVTEISNADFSHVVLTVSESDMKSADRQARLLDAIHLFNSRDIEVWADPWRIGGVHGGEAASFFEQSGEKGCFCNPKLDSLVNKWIQTVGHLGVSKVFWDEPEMKCDEHSNDELHYIERYTGIANDLGLRSAVCLTANQKKKWQLEELATYDTVEEIATDPYYPNAFMNISESNRLEYVKDWAFFTKDVAEKNGKLSHVWVQTFNVANGREYIVPEHIEVCRRTMSDIALWGFNACKSVPDFIKPHQASADDVWESAVSVIKTAKG